MNALHRAVGAKPDLPVIEFRPTPTSQENKPQPISHAGQEKDEQEDIFDWLSNH
jgi:hypothetical protein